MRTKTRWKKSDSNNNYYGTYTSSDFKCLALSVPDEGKSRKALPTHEIIKRVVFNFLHYI